MDEEDFGLSRRDGQYERDSSLSGHQLEFEFPIRTDAKESTEKSLNMKMPEELQMRISQEGLH